MRFAYLGPTTTEPEEELLGRLFSRHEYLAVDVETVGLKDTTLIGVGVAFNSTEAFYFPVLPEPSPFVGKVLELIKDPGTTRILHNAMFDLEVLGIDGVPFEDTSIMAQVQGLPANLQDLTHFYLQREIQEIRDILPARKTMLDVPTEVTAHKCMEDVLNTYRLFELMGGSSWGNLESGHSWTYRRNYEFGYDVTDPTTHYVSPQMKDCYQVDLKLIPLLRRMSKRGIALRPEMVRIWYDLLGREINNYKVVCDRMGFEPNSPQQVGFMLAKRGNILPFTKSKKHRQLRVDEDTLLDLDDPLAMLILNYRKRSKLHSTYLKPWLGAERAYTTFRMDLSTRRLASFNRNLQNIPPNIRIIFAPDTGTWTDADASQVEMRIFAHLTQDPIMIKAYRDNEDIHAITQQALWPGSDLKNKEQRRRAKTFNFAMIFYAEELTLKKQTRLPLASCSTYRMSWLNNYGVAWAWMRKQAEESYKGYAETLMGRRMRLPSLDQSTPGHREKCAINYPVQGTAADLIKRAMLTVMDLDLVLQVHDELLFDGDLELPVQGWEHIIPGVYTPFEVRKGPVWV